MNIVTYPSSILSSRCESVTVFDHNLKTLSLSMIKLMHELNGVGLAAPQVGVLVNLIVVDESCGLDKNELDVMVNPKIINSSVMKKIQTEGCLSIPFFSTPVSRYTTCVVEYNDLLGNRKVSEFFDLKARIVQHEIDHLNGITIIDTVSSRPDDLLYVNT